MAVLALTPVGAVAVPPLDGQRLRKAGGGRRPPKGEHEKRAGGRYDENWPDWYADYMSREQTGVGRGPLAPAVPGFIPMGSAAS